jgi:hypothetical protein
MSSAATRRGKQQMRSLAAKQDEQMSSLAVKQDEQMDSLAVKQDEQMDSLAVKQDEQVISLAAKQDEQMSSLAAKQDEPMSSLAALCHKLDLSEAVYRATQGLAALKLKVSGITSVARTEEGWRVTLELIERVAVPDTMDLLGVYEVRLDHGGELIGYERTRIRHRCDLEEKAE